MGDENFATTPTRPASALKKQGSPLAPTSTVASHSSPSVFGKSPKWRVEEPSDPNRYVKWTAYDKPAEFPTAVQALVTRRGWTNPWNPASPAGKVAEAKRCVARLRERERKCDGVGTKRVSPGG